MTNTNNNTSTTGLTEQPIAELEPAVDEPASSAAAIMQRIAETDTAIAANEKLGVDADPYMIQLVNKLRAKEVCALIMKGRTTLWEWVKSGRFPAPFHHGSRFAFWPRAIVTAWIAEHGVTPRRHPKPRRRKADNARKLVAAFRRCGRAESTPFRQRQLVPSPQRTPTQESEQPESMSPMIVEKK